MCHNWMKHHCVHAEEKGILFIHVSDMQKMQYSQERGNIQTLVEVSIFGFVFFQMKMDTYQNILVWLGPKPANERESLNMQRQAGIFQRLICYSLRSH